MATKQHGQIVETPTEARGAEPGPSVFALLTISTGPRDPDSRRDLVRVLPHLRASNAATSRARAIARLDRNETKYVEASHA